MTFASVEAALDDGNFVGMIEDKIIDDSEFQRFCTAFGLSPNIYLQLVSGHARGYRALRNWRYAKTRTLADLANALFAFSPALAAAAGLSENASELWRIAFTIDMLSFLGVDRDVELQTASAQLCRHFHQRVDNLYEGVDNSLNSHSGYPRAQTALQVLTAAANRGVPVQTVVDVLEAVGKKDTSQRLARYAEGLLHPERAIQQPVSSQSAAFQTAASSNPFASLAAADAKKVEAPPTMGAVVTANVDMNYQNVCRILTKTGLWEGWLTNAKLLRTVEIVNFVDNLKARQAVEGAKFNAAHTVFEGVCQGIEAWRDKPLDQFLDSLMNLGNQQLGEAVAEWIGELGGRNFDALVATDTPQEVRLHIELRKLFDQDNKVFRDPVRLNAALDALVSPKHFGMLTLADLKVFTDADFVTSGYFNIREARAVVEIANTL